MSDAVRVGPFGLGRPYHTFVREERQFCAVLYHLLVSNAENMAAFLQLVRDASGACQFDSPPPIDPRLAEVYVEFALLRDYWHGLMTDPDRLAFLRLLIDRLPHGRTVVLPDVAALTWSQVFARMHIASSLPIVRSLVESEALT